MKFSLIVPVYNVEKYLGKCLDSLTGQTFSDLEIILVNDGSVDSSEQICREYAARDERIRYFCQKNAGTSAARNAGIKNAAGDYILLVDGDDFILPESCEVIAGLLKKHNYPDILMLDALYYNEDGTTSPKRKNKVWTGTDSAEEFWLENIKRRAMPSSPVVHICRRELLQNGRFEFPEGRRHEDVYWVAKAYFYAERAVYEPYAFYMHVMRDDSLTHSALPERSTDLLWIAGELESFFELEGNASALEDYRCYCCYLYGVSVHTAMLSGLSVGKVFSREERRFLSGHFLKSGQAKYKLLGLVLKLRMWKIYGIFYCAGRRKA